MTSTDPRAMQLAESRYRNGYGPTVADGWDTLDPSTRQFLVSEAESWLGAAVAAGLMARVAPTAEDLAAADDPTQLRWGLDDVLYGDDDTVTVLLSDEERRPYWLELDPERAAVLRWNLAGPDGEQPTDEENGRRPCGHDDYHDRTSGLTGPACGAPASVTTTTPPLSVSPPVAIRRGWLPDYPAPAWMTP